MRSQLRKAKQVVLHSAASSLPLPTTSASGTALYPTITNAPSSVIELKITASAACTLAAVKLWGYDGTDWLLLSQPNSGISITMTLSGSIILGYSQRYRDIGMYDRLAVSASYSGANVTVSVREIEYMKARL